METWNGNCIRPEKQRPNHIAGIPNELYTDQSFPRYGSVPIAKLLLKLNKAVKDVGN